MLRVLLIHNYYQMPGGEDVVFAAEKRLLQEHGHDVAEYVEDNHKVRRMNAASLAAGTIWSRSAHRALSGVIRHHRPDVVHFHNTFPLISPSSYYAAMDHGVPVVQSLHNYRLLCPGALLFRRGGVCEECVGKTIPWPALVHGCYRGSRAATAAVSAMLAIHRMLRTWRCAVTRYVALTGFAREKFVEGGLPTERILIKPNFLPLDPGMGRHDGQHMLFVGRLSAEKGLDTLLDAWRLLGGRVPLKIVGDGVLAQLVKTASDQVPGIEYLGLLAGDRVRQLMKDASALIVPSLWYEGFPMVVAEAYATGLPVIGSALGGLSTIIDHGRTGLLFAAGDHCDLAASVAWADSHKAELAVLGRSARREYELKYSAEPNYRLLLGLYEQAVATNGGATTGNGAAQS